MLQSKTFPSNNRIHTFLLAFIIFFFALLIITYPEEAVKSSLHGLNIWWNVVFPSLLPFFITAELMLSLGVVNFFGILLEPLMRPIFRVPGVGAFVMAVALISGNPMGAKLTARLREQNLVTREEGERLISFTSTAGPLFIFGAVSVGFFESSTLGIILAAAHYVSAFIVGFLMRFYKAQAPTTPINPKRAGFILFRAFTAMHKARIEDKRPIGRLLGEAVTSSIQTLLLIGGFIMAFSVVTHLIDYIGLDSILSLGLGYILKLLTVPNSLADPLLVGCFEITLGSQLASLTTVPLLYKCMVVSFIIAFNGLSIHAQIISMLSKTDIRYLPYFTARIMHGIIATIVTWLLFDPLSSYLDDLPVATMDVFHNSIKPLWGYCQMLSYLIIIIWLVQMIRRSARKL